MRTQSHYYVIDPWITNIERSLATEHHDNCTQLRILSSVYTANIIKRNILLYDDNEKAKRDSENTELKEIDNNV